MFKLISRHKLICSSGTGHSRSYCFHTFNHSCFAKLAFSLKRKCPKTFLVSVTVVTRLCPILCLDRLTSHFTNLEFDQVFLISVPRLLNRGKSSHISLLISVQSVFILSTRQMCLALTIHALYRLHRNKVS